MKKFHFNKITDVLAVLLYPKKCVVCQQSISSLGKIALCDKCSASLPKTKVVRDDRFFFDEAIAFIPYEASAREAMIKYKFKSVKYCYKAYAHIISLAEKERPYLKGAVVCPVPVSKTRDRDYSQTDLIARELADIWESRYIPDLLYRCRVVSQVSKMKLFERKFYTSGSIDVHPRYSVYGKDVLVVDDILTSGTTANECARVLKIYGARNVYILCPCYD